MTLPKRFLIVACFVLAIIASATIALNLWQPKAYHFATAARFSDKGIVTADPTIDLTASGAFGTLAEILRFTPTSRMLLRLSPGKCDMPIFENGERRQGRNAAITTYVSFYRFMPGADDLFIRDMLSDTMKECDPNAKSEHNVYPPFVYVIALRHIDLIDLFLEGGIDLDRPIDAEGKVPDGMKFEEYAQYLSDKADSIDSKDAYAEIARNIRQRRLGEMPRKSGW